MKYRVKVIFPDNTLKDWFLSVEHTESYCGLPVLVDGNNQAYKPDELPPGTFIQPLIKNLVISKNAKNAGYPIQD